MSECHEEVYRGGEAQPCGKVAVALRYDPEEGTPYPVCGRHARGRMVSLAERESQMRAEIAAAIRDVVMPNSPDGMEAQEMAAKVAEGLPLDPWVLSWSDYVH